MRKWASNWVIIAILALAAFFRLYRLDEIPLGISHDEAGNALVALEVLKGNHSVFFEVNKGIESLMIYLQAGFVALMGMGPIALRLPAALAGIATVLCTYLLVRLLFSTRVANFAALGIAAAFWPVFVSRIGLRAVTLPLIETLAFYFLWRGLKSGGRANFALAGFFLGGSLYTYLSARFLPFAVLGFLGYFLLRMPKRRMWGNLAVCLSIALVTALPIGLYFWSNAESFTLRASQVNDLRFVTENRDFGPLLTDSLNTLGMFTVSGDPSSRYNLAGRPVFDPFGSVLFVLGLFVVLRRLRSSGPSAPQTDDLRRRIEPPVAEVFLLIWLATMLLPSAITGESPHFWRSVGAIPPTFALLGIGADACWRFVESRRAAPARYLLPAAAALVFAFAAVSSYRDYFNGWATDAEARDIYRADTAGIARFLNGWDGSDRLMMGVEYPYDLDRYVLNVLRGGRETEATWFDATQTLVIPERGKDGAYYFFPSFARPPRGLLERYSPPTSSLAETPLIYRIDSSDIPTPEPDHLSSLQLGPLLLLGYDVAGDGSAGGASRTDQLQASTYARDTVTVALYWKVEETPDPNAKYSFFAHLIGNWGRMWSQKDMSPYPEESWRVGDVIINRHEIELPPGLPPNPYTIEAGVYSRKSGARLQTADGQDRLRIEGIMTMPSSVAAGGKKIDIQNRLSVDFEYGATLIGYDLVPPILKAGEPLELTLFWLPRSDIAKNYKVFNHLLDSKGAMVAQRDGEPADGFYSTGRWKSGELVRDKYTIPIPPDAAPGEYRINSGLYNAENGVRLNVLGPKAGIPERLERLLDWLLARRETIGEDHILLRPIVVERR